jgi:hypothetical protein
MRECGNVERVVAPRRFPVPGSRFPTADGRMPTAD